MRKHRLIYGFSVLAVAVVLGLFYYGTKNDAKQSNSHIIPSDLNSTPSLSNKVSESVQKDKPQVSIKNKSLKQPEHRPVKQEPQFQPDTVDGNPIILTKKKVVLEDGKEIMVFENVPDSWRTETEVHFDKGGKPHVTHR
ncbi:MAG: hypothetical protein F4Z13_06425 [Candidatus Dadabacteria bacterium]|nr:hypothetical protein [Candidatus Dadabacteria bacterium]